jgi:hypothetical protein
LTNGSRLSPELELSQEKDTHEQEMREKEIDNILAQIRLSDLRIQADREEIVDLWSAFSTRRYANGNRLKVDTRKMLANLTSLIK